MCKVSSLAIFVVSALAAGIPGVGKAECLPKETIVAFGQGVDIEQGRAQFGRCMKCHVLTRNGIHKTGPNLWGVFGASVARHENYAYSKALGRVEGVWGARELDSWLKRPNTYVPRSRMTFSGITDKEERRHLIAFLECAPVLDEKGEL